MTTFALNSVYSMNSVCDSNCVWSYRVTRVTAASVWLQPLRNGEPSGEVIRRRITSRGGVQQCMPQGSYSMAPILTAEKLVK